MDGKLSLPLSVISQGEIQLLVHLDQSTKFSLPYSLYVFVLRSNCSRFFQIHRPFTDIHLPAAWNGLFSVAGAAFIPVIYIIIATEMKTDHTTNVAASYFKRMQSLMAVAGIVIAIICSLILLHETDLSRHESEQSGIVESSKSVITHRVLELSDLSVHSVLLRLK
jgi:hypothetical protein